MSIPESTEVPVIGGGPAGSYAASALAGEGIDTVVLERGEIMLPSLRHFFRFADVDLDSTFIAYGFYRKIGAAFVLNNKDPACESASILDEPVLELSNPAPIPTSLAPVAQTPVLGTSSAPRPTTSSSDMGARAALKSSMASRSPPLNLRPTKAQVPPTTNSGPRPPHVSYLGRMGIMSTKYLENRHFNQGLKNAASWGYWQGTGRYGVGTPQEGVSYFEALSDSSGWVWFIPLHGGTTSVGVVINQDIAIRKKKEMGSPGGKIFYLEMLKAAPRILGPMLEDATLVSEIKAASDWP
ncbi:hypothetical protein DL762_000161 [Monosporascus cannonballus]|uniref:FAD-binding domain-containing protein n=1 Tax=Monosporascus cannonballus TaxID=155416 RepID=A0ABY0HKK8_9PEZI|nr:hypothetical protein DL762_000161 [Monosporascus cannonballus]